MTSQQDLPLTSELNSISTGTGFIQIFGSKLQEFFQFFSKQ